MKKAIIVDIDGTIADLTHRLHWIKNPHGVKDWKRFFAAAYKDKPKKQVIELIKFLAEHYHIIFLTGRPRLIEGITIRWLLNHFPSSKESRKYSMIMRLDGDIRPDHKIKKEIYKNQIQKKFEVIGVFEDRQRVVDMWRELGLTCYQVDQWEED